PRPGRGDVATVDDLSDQERADRGPDVVDAPVAGRDDEDFVDVRADPHTRERRLGAQVEAGPHLVAHDCEFRHGRRFDDAILGSAIQAAPQVIPREAGLDADLRTSAVRCECDIVGAVGGQRVDVSLREGDALGLGEDAGGGHRMRSMMVPVDSAPPAHMVIRAVLLSVRSNSCRAVVISLLPVEPTGWPSAMAPPLTLTRSMSGS